MHDVQDRADQLRDAVAGLKKKKREMGKEVTSRRNALKKKTLTDEQRAEADRLHASAQERLATIESKLAHAEATLRMEEAHEFLKRAHAARQSAGDAAFLAAKPETNEVQFCALVQELINLRATINRLGGRNDALTEFVRTWVLEHPTGWTTSDDPEKWYLAWVSSDGTLQVVLQDQPAYELTVEALVQLIGFQAAMQFLKVGFGAVEKAAEDGLLRDQVGELLTVERLRGLRERHERAKQVKALERGAAHVGDVIAVIAPELVPQFTAEIETLGLDHETVRALRAADITRVGQLRRSGDDLQRIKGIGIARAQEILAKVAQVPVAHVAESVSA